MAGIPLTVPFDLANANPLDTRLISFSTEQRNAVMFRYPGMWHWTVGQGMFYVGDDFQFRPLSFLIESIVNEGLPQMVATSVETYLLANPVSVSPEALAYAIEAYLTANPVTAEVDPTQLASAIEQYFIAHPIEGGGSASPLLSRTVEQIKTMLSEGTIVPGQHYLISDFVPVSNVFGKESENISVLLDAEPLIFRGKNIYELETRGLSTLYYDIVEFNPYSSEPIYVFDVDGTTVIQAEDYSKGKITYRNSLERIVETYFDFRAARTARYKYLNVTPNFPVTDTGVANTLSFVKDIRAEFAPNGSGDGFRTIFIPSVDKSNVTTLISAEGFSFTVKDHTGTNGAEVNLEANKWYLIHLVPCNYIDNTGVAFIFDLQYLKDTFDNQYHMPKANEPVELAGSFINPDPNDYLVYNCFENNTIGQDIYIGKYSSNDYPNILFKQSAEKVYLGEGSQDLTLGNVNGLHAHQLRRCMAQSIYNTAFSQSSSDIWMQQGFQNAKFDYVHGMWGNFIFESNGNEVDNSFIFDMGLSKFGIMRRSLVVGSHASDFGQLVSGLCTPYTFAFNTIKAYLEDCLFQFQVDNLTILTPAYNKCFTDGMVQNSHIYAGIATTSTGMPRLISLTSPDGKVWEQVVDNAGVTTNIAATEVI